MRQNPYLSNLQSMKANHSVKTLPQIGNRCLEVIEANRKHRAVIRRRRLNGQEPSAEELPAQPLVSIIVLNLNGEKIISRCLDHLLAQTYRNFEIIVVDNGSTDSSLEILADYSSDHQVLVLQSRSNLGIPGGRNYAAASARGEILAFVDNDGYADQNWLVCALQTLALRRRRWCGEFDGLFCGSAEFA